MRYLDFFDPTRASTIKKPLEEAYARGARKIVVVGARACSGVISSRLKKLGLSWVDKNIADFHVSDITDNTLIVISSGTGDDVSQVLHACIGSNVAVIAPITDHHISQRTVFLMSIPKAGTHMMIRLLNLMGLEWSSDHAPRPGAWSTPVGFEYHAPCRELLANDWFSPVGRQLLFRSPAIFVYRNPLDIVVSELDWFVKEEHAFSGYLNCCADDGERLRRLIADETVMGSIRDRINRYAGWMNFGNVIPISYEELVGSRGGGSDTQQSDSIWALQMKLHISGSPESFGNQLYDTGSATFSKGRIGRHMERFESEHFVLYNSLQQDFVHTLGYAQDSPISSRVAEMLRRPLVVKRLSNEQLYIPRLVSESLLGWNIVEIAGQYFPVQQGEQIGSYTEAQTFSRMHKGFMTITDAVSFITNPTASEYVPADSLSSAGAALLVECFLGFNIVHHQSCWYGFNKNTGPIDIASLDAESIEAMQKNKQCVTGDSIAEIKAEILNLTVQEQLDAVKEQQESANTHYVDTNHQLNKLQSSLDLELKSFQEQLDNIKEQQKPTHPNGLIVEDYFGFNIVHHQSCWYGFNKNTGPIDIASLDAESIEAMQKNKQCVTGDSIAEIKAEILNLTVQEQLDAVKEQQESAGTHCVEIDNRLNMLRAGIDSAQLQLSTELKSIQERLDTIKELTESISHNPLVRIGHVMDHLFILKSTNNE
ncbi:MAG: hypothetical protein H8D34_10715 [Chloroflexi bacterium]|nr:hypothetical protein [Chloroflexota bacterium]